MKDVRSVVRTHYAFNRVADPYGYIDILLDKDNFECEDLSCLERNEVRYELDQRSTATIAKQTLASKTTLPGGRDHEGDRGDVVQVE